MDRIYGKTVSKDEYTGNSDESMVTKPRLGEPLAPPTDASENLPAVLTGSNFSFSSYFFVEGG